MLNSRIRLDAAVLSRAVAQANGVTSEFLLPQFDGCHYNRIFSPLSKRGLSSRRGVHGHPRKVRLDCYFSTLKVPTRSPVVVASPLKALPLRLPTSVS